jgi:hypothetical protein
MAKPFGYGPAGPDRDLPIAAANPEAAPDVLVLDDAGDGFRRAEQADLWCLPEPGDGKALPGWIVLKLAGSIGRGDLWDRLMLCGPGACRGSARPSTFWPLSCASPCWSPCCGRVI